MENSIAVWEDDGGSKEQGPENGLIGTVNQIAWAMQIRRQLDAEFDRVRGALESVARKPAKNHFEADMLITILEDKRAEVMARTEAGYFIHDWQELRSQVRQMIMDDSRYRAIKSRT